MRNQIMLLALLTTSVLVGCQKETVGEGEGGGTALGEKAYVVLDVKMPSSVPTRAAVGSDLGTADESNIADIQAIFFDGHSANSLVVAVVSGADLGTPGTPSGTTGRPVQISSDAKSVLVIANLGSVITVGTDYSTVNAIVANATTATIIGNDGKKFLMTNAKGSLEPSNADGTAKDLTLYNSANAAAAAPPTVIRIDRVAAKVTTTLGPKAYEPDETKDKYTVSDAQWVLSVINKKYFPLSIRSYTYVEAQAKAGGSFLPTANDAYGLGSYRVDPNYTGQKAKWPNIGALDAAYATEYNVFSQADDVAGSITWNTPKAPGASTGTDASAYCTENTQDKADNYQAFITQVLVKAKLTPKKVVKPDGTEVAVTAGSDWFLVNSQFYTWETLMLFIEKEVDTYIAASRKGATPLTTSLNIYLQATTEPLTVDLSTVASGAAAVALFEAQKTVAMAAAKSKGGVSFYKNSINYYYISMKHDDTGLATNELGEFGVVRNSSYNVAITAIKNPGSPAIPVPDPEEPGETEDKYLSVSISVNAWGTYSQSEEL